MGRGLFGGGREWSHLEGCSSDKTEEAEPVNEASAARLGEWVRLGNHFRIPPGGVRIDGTGATSAENTTGAVEQDYNRESSYTYI